MLKNYVKFYRMKKVLLILAVTVISYSVIAQNQDKPIENKAHEFGFQAGFTTGVGLSYRYWPGKFGVQITALPVKSSDVTFVSLGLTGMYSIYNSRHTRFFLYLANSYNINKYVEETDYYNYNTGYYEYREEHVNNNAYNIGFGPGFGFGTRVRFNIMAGYGFYDVFGEFNMLPTVEAGLYFRF